MTNTDMSLRDAAQAVIDRWETPLWKDAPATAVFIADLRDALARDAGDMFEFWWADHAPNATQEEAWAEWCSLMRPGPVVAAPPTAQAEGWISVDERLPEPDGPVLAHNGKWTGVAAWMSGEYLEPLERWQDEHREFIEMMGPAITHWMPLPPAPTSAEGVEP